MTAVDHRPYLADTDLRTAEDVARWLREHAEQWRRDAVADPSVGARSVRLDYAGLCALQGAHADLRARLDRERRQACRRGALDRWGRVRELVRWARAYRNASWAWDEIAPSLWFALCNALAFRAAARGVVAELVLAPAERRVDDV